VKRIADVRTLRLRQFPEDSGPLAHNVRPERYHEINNFYTATIYEKGAEIIRMLRHLIGAEVFSQGMTLYFDRYDGTAATIEDFLSCFADASGRDLAHFKLWYEQAGTPELRVAVDFDENTNALTIDLSQETAPTPGQPIKQPLVIPIAFGLVGVHGLPIGLSGLNVKGITEAELRSGVIELSSQERRIAFSDLPSRAVPSLLRSFSAPVKTVTNLTEDDLVALLTYDSDSFNRWQAAQTLATRGLIKATAQVRKGGQPEAVNAALVDAFGAVLDDEKADPAFVAQVITLPSEADIARDLGRDVDPDAIHVAREAMRRALGSRLHSRLLSLRRPETHPAPYSPAAPEAGRRALRNTALWLLAGGDADEGAQLAAAQFEAADNMTDRLAALGVISLIPGTLREDLLGRFHAMFEHDALVGDKWLGLQASIPEPSTLGRVRALMTHPAFSMATPNRVYALIGGFSANPTQFNRLDGAGYDFVAEIVIALDGKNPQVAARILNAFRAWRTMDRPRQERAEAALRRIAVQPVLSADVRDIVTRSLG
jgi:aminopeptidase N